MSAAVVERRGPLSSVPASDLPRLLAGVRGQGGMSLEQHLAHHGALPRVRARGRRRTRERAQILIDELERSGLQGRGGAAFPTARKMRAVAQARGRAIVVANGAEGEPASLKDRTLLALAPHLVLDGAVLAAEALGADEAIIAVCESDRAGAKSIGLAIAELDGKRASPKLSLARVPSDYVAGQESALVNHLGGGPAKPTFTPPMPFQQGLRRRPTLINNVETLAHLALIARHGASWFRQLGTPTEPGSALVTLSGPVGHPGVYEIEHGASIASLIAAAGGATGGVRGVLLGGYAGGVDRRRAHARHLPVERAARRARRDAGSRRGAAALHGSLPGHGNGSAGALAGGAERSSVRTVSVRTRCAGEHDRGDRCRQSAPTRRAADRAARIARNAPGGLQSP